ncbi:Alpha/Beta hydrolase protein [Stachybotrys elegans]|uniref:Alpha/Beta hydrolase protein n=1 Tax=Stachybotrys elegans TaxID=80388 RepID=A0A8K0SI44_9HYPO|nr:Alpha/Beta hydrolase protein [Stachybotrys elegans]
MVPQTAFDTGAITTQDGAKLQYIQAGPADGKQLLLIHGWSQTAAQWRKQLEYFSANGFRVIAYDQRGHGESEKVEFGYRVSRLGTDLNELLIQLDLKDLTIVGHSMGSSVIWSLWDQHPESRSRLSKLVFADQASTMVSNPKWTEAEVADISSCFTPLSLFALTNDLENQGEVLVRGMFTESLSESDFQWVMAQNRKLSRDKAAKLLVDHATRDWSDVFPRITVPCFVIGAETSLFPPTGIARIATLLPNAKSYIFKKEEGGNHFMFWENPELFNRLVHEFATE